MSPRDRKEQAATKPNLANPSIDQSQSFEIDIKLAARIDGPVLITATPDDALAIARLIGSARRDCHVEVVTCDPANGEDVVAAMADARLRPRTGSEKRILLLREVHTLTPSDQAALMDRLAERQLEPLEQSARILASSAAHLFEYVVRGSFDERLFYCLNGMHIIGLSRSGAT